MNDFKKDIREKRKEYLEKFKDPQWQKLRLKIFERDNWTCQNCGDDKSTLNIHHRYYLENMKPWEYPMEALITLCEDCHIIEKELRQDNEKILLLELRKRFLSQDIFELSYGLFYMKLLHSPDVVASVYSWAFMNEDIQRELIDKYFKNIEKEKKQRNGKKTKTKR